MTPATAAAQSSLTEIFSSQFALQCVAPSDERIYNLRYRVFCEELGYAMKVTDKGEADDFDPQAKHFLLSHQGVDVGYVRILSGRDTGLPCEGFGFKHADPSRLDLSTVEVKRSSEASRLAIIAEARRPTRYTDPEGNVRSFPLGLFALYSAIANNVLEGGLSHVFMVGEPRLHKHVVRMGFNMKQGSEPFEYFGSRALFFYEREQLLQDIRELPAERKAVLQSICRSLNTRCEPSMSELVA